MREPEPVTATFRRPVPVYDCARGLLHNEHFQLGFVTNDIDAAVEVFRRRFGVDCFRETEQEVAGKGRISIRSVWIGNMIYEICCATGEGMTIYTDSAPIGGDFILKLHHFGYLVADASSWQALEQTLARGNWVIRSRTDLPGLVQTCMVEAPELGPYLEFIFPGPQLIERFNATPGAR